MKQGLGFTSEPWSRTGRTALLFLRFLVGLVFVEEDFAVVEPSLRMVSKQSNADT